MEDTNSPLSPHERFGHAKQIYFLKVQRMAHANLLGTVGRYRKQVGMVDSDGKTFGFMEVDAQAAFPLSTSEGQQKTGKRPTRERQQS